MVTEIVGAGAPAVTVATETPAAAPAPARPAPVYEQSTPAPGTGETITLSKDQLAAKTEMDRLRPLTLSDPVAKKQFREIADYIYNGAPQPAFLRPAQQLENRVVPAGGDLTDVARSAYEPATQASEYAIKPHEIPQNVFPSPEDQHAVISDLQGWMHKLQLPAHTGSEIISDVLHHLSVANDFVEEDGSTSTLLSPTQAADHAEECSRILAAAGGEAAMRSAAQAYLDHVLTPAQMGELKAAIVQGDRVSSIYYSPRIIWRLASMARAKGWAS